MAKFISMKILLSPIPIDLRDGRSAAARIVAIPLQTRIMKNMKRSTKKKSRPFSFLKMELVLLVRSTLKLSKTVKKPLNSWGSLVSELSESPQGFVAATSFATVPGSIVMTL